MILLLEEEETTALYRVCTCIQVVVCILLVVLLLLLRSSPDTLIAVPCKPSWRQIGRFKYPLNTWIGARTRRCALYTHRPLVGGMATWLSAGTC